MIKTLFILALFAPVAYTQGIGGSAGVGGIAGFGGGTTTSAAPALVRQCAAPGVSSGTTMTCTMGGTPSSGNVILLGYTTSVSASGPPAVAQSNVSWTRVSAADGNATNRLSTIWCGTVSASAGTAITITLPFTATTNTNQEVTAAEFSGVSCTSPVGNGANGTSTTPTTATITPTAGNNVIFACTRMGGAPVGGGGTPTNGFTALTIDGTAVRDEYSYLIVSPASGTYSTGWTAGSGAWAASIVAAH